MNENLLKELELVCQRIADSSVSAELKGDKSDGDILDKARKEFVGEVWAIVQNPKLGSNLLLSVISPDGLPPNALPNGKKVIGTVTKAMLLHDVKTIAARVFNLIQDGKKVEALRSLVDLSWRGGVWATYNGEAQRSKRGGKATGGLNKDSKAFQKKRDKDQAAAERTRAIFQEEMKKTKLRKTALYETAQRLSVEEGKTVTVATVEKRLQRLNKKNH